MLNPQDYDYLWTDYDINFIFTSCYLFKELRETDIVFIYDHKKKGLGFFLSKRDRERLSRYGLEFYEKHFDKWKQNIRKNIEAGKKLIKETKENKKQISLFTNSELSNRIMQRVNLFQSLGGNYFYTEFFFLDRVEKVVNEKKANRTMLKNLKEMSKLKFQAREVLTHFYNYKKIFGPYVEEVAKRIQRKDLPWLSYVEISELLEGKNVPASSRGKYTWILAKATKWQPVTGQKASATMQAFHDYFFNKNVEEIKGTIANTGICKGKAKILRTLFSDNMLQELKKVENGDILVAETTGPDMMIACERAAAIVTDEGGITSHAAIVSRELGIPCIVGTKIATKLLKDNDVIEVDANAGVVRKIAPTATFK